jgi:hypothetical protein
LNRVVVFVQLNEDGVITPPTAESTVSSSSSVKLDITSLSDPPSHSIEEEEALELEQVTKEEVACNPFSSSVFDDVSSPTKLEPQADNDDDNDDSAPPEKKRKIDEAAPTAISIVATIARGWTKTHLQPLVHSGRISHDKFQYLVKRICDKFVESQSWSFSCIASLEKKKASVLRLADKYTERL